MDIQENDNTFALERKETVLTVDGYRPVTWKHNHDDSIPDEEEAGIVILQVNTFGGRIELSAGEAEGLVQALQKSIGVASGEPRVRLDGIGFFGDVDSVTDNKEEN